MKTIDIVFESETATGGCACDACRNVGQVIKLRLPSTRYFNGKVLSTKYENYWLCAKCRDKLTYALNWPEKED